MSLELLELTRTLQYSNSLAKRLSERLWRLSLRSTDTTDRLRRENNEFNRNSLDLIITKLNK